MNKIPLAPTSLPNTPPLEYLEVTLKAGYQAIGLRVFRSSLTRAPRYDFPRHLGEVNAHRFAWRFAAGGRLVAPRRF